MANGKERDIAIIRAFRASPYVYSIVTTIQ